MDAMASQTTSLTIVYSTVYSDADQRKHQRSASLAFALGIHPLLCCRPEVRIPSSQATEGIATEGPHRFLDKG